MTVKITVHGYGPDGAEDPHEVEAYEHGDFFAIHRDRTVPRRWVVTHVPTGWRCGQPLPTKAECRKRADALLAVPVGWAEGDPRKLKQDPHFADAARAIGARHASEYDWCAR
jgi:hypothetical protein